MQKAKRIVLSVLMVAISASAWAWGLVKAEVKDPKLPKVLLIGDSIMGGYWFDATKQLEGKATVDTWGNPYNQANNSWHTELKGVLTSNGPYAVIHFNVGLHGWRKGDIPEGQYETLTSKCVETIRQYAPGATILWARTTPIVTTNRPFALDPVANAVIVSHNAMAASVMQKYGIPVVDLYTVMLPHLEWSHGDRVHWEGNAYHLMGNAVARAIEAALTPAK